MAAYLAIAVLPIIFRLIAEKIKMSKRNQFIILSSFLVLFLIQCLRNINLVGTDIPTYCGYFDHTIQLTWKELFTEKQWEYGYWALNKLIGYVTKNHQVFLSIMSFLILFPIAYTYIKESKMPLITYGMFLCYDIFLLTFSGLRQSLAIAIVVFAYRFVKKANVKNVILYYLLVAIAFTFHTSAIVAIVIYPIYHLPIKRAFLPFILVFVIMVYILRKPLALTAFKIIGGKYVDRYGTITDTGAGGMLLFDILIMTCSFLFARKENKILIGLRNLMIMVVLVRIFTTINIVAIRMSYYFIPFVALLVPEVLAVQSETDKNIVFVGKIGIYIGAVALMIYVLLVHDGTGIYPYYPFWAG